MNTQQTEPAYRAISVITLIQAGVVVFGTLGVTVMCKYKGYGNGSVPDWFFRSDALFIRASGWQLLAIPPLWAVLTIVAARLELNRWMQITLFVGGILMILAGALYFFTLAFNPTIL